MKNSKLEELRKEYVGKEMKLLKLDGGIEDYSLDYLFASNEVYNLQIGNHETKMQGNYSFAHEGCEEGEEINFTFETVGNWEVVDNAVYSNINTTRIDKNSVTIKIIDMEII